LNPSEAQTSIRPGNIHVTFKLITTLVILLNLILLSGDIHPNPGPTPVHTNHLSVYFLNAQSLKATNKKHSKLLDFKNMIHILQPDIIAINETWLIKEIPNSEITNEDEYAVYRKDRHEDTQGGGVLIMIKTPPP